MSLLVLADRLGERWGLDEDQRLELLQALNDVRRDGAGLPPAPALQQSGRGPDGVCTTCKSPPEAMHSPACPYAARPSMAGYGDQQFGRPGLVQRQPRRGGKAGPDEDYDS